MPFLVLKSRSLVRRLVVYKWCRCRLMIYLLVLTCWCSLLVRVMLVGERLTLCVFRLPVGFTRPQQVGKVLRFLSSLAMNLRLLSSVVGPAAVRRLTADLSLMAVAVS